MASPDAREVHFSRPLTDVSVAYKQSNTFIADKVFPTVNVRHQGNLYRVYDRGAFLRTAAGLRAPGTETPGAGWTYKNEPYFANVIGVHHDIDDQTRANSDDEFNQDREATEFVTGQLLMRRDLDWHAKYMRTGVWTGATGVGGGANGADLKGGATAGSNTLVFWNRADSDPIGDLDTQITGMARLTGMRPNKMVIGPDVLSALKNSPAIIERVKYSQKGLLSEDLIAEALGVPEILVTWATHNAAPLGTADDIDFHNAKSAVLLYAAESAGLQTASAGLTFVWTGLLGAGAHGGRVKKFRMEQIASDRIEAEMAYDQKVTASDLGVFFHNIVE